MIELTPTSSWAVPVMVNVVVGITLPDGPLIDVVGVASASPNVSIFLMAFVASWLPLTPTVLASSWIRWLPEIVSGSDHVRGRGVR